MKIIRAEHLGMCFGVRDAIALALDAAQHESLTVLGDLVHNENVLAELRAQGIRVPSTSVATVPSTAAVKKFESPMKSATNRVAGCL